MNLELAKAQSDTVATVDIGGAVFQRFMHHVEKKQPIKYGDRMNPNSFGHYNILHAVKGLPGQINFYLKRVDLMEGINV